MNYGDKLEIHGMALTVHKWSAEELERLEMTSAEHGLPGVEGRLWIPEEDREQPIELRTALRDSARADEKYTELKEKNDLEPSEENETALQAVRMDAAAKRRIKLGLLREEQIEMEIERDELFRKRHLTYCHLFAAVAEGDGEVFMDNAPYDGDALNQIEEVLTLGKWSAPFSHYRLEWERRSVKKNQTNQIAELLKILNDSGANSNSKLSELELA